MSGFTGSDPLFSMRRVIFITGTGTGVGKTVLTALLLSHLRREGHDALAIKPFCCGSRNDARLLQGLQKDAMTLGQTNPFFFKRPLAPWVEAREKRAAQIPLPEVLRKIRAINRRARIVLLEGCGGVLVPLGDGYGIGDLMREMVFNHAGTQCNIIAVAPNCLGTINHTLLTAKYLQSIGIKELVVVMMGQKRPDLSSRSNVHAIGELMPGVPVHLLPYLGEGASNIAVVKQNAKYLKKMLAQVLDSVKLATVPSKWKGDCNSKSCGPSKQVPETPI
ncbi:MAG: dethiobiotin synthase [Verrucomicrobiota bacterium]